MKKNQKVLIVNQPASETLIDLLLAAGFETTEEISDRIVRASISPEAFSEAHAAFLQAACNHPALIGCSRFDAYPAPVLIVHRREVESIEHGAESLEPTSEPSALAMPSAPCALPSAPCATPSAPCAMPSATEAELPPEE